MSAKVLLYVQHLLGIGHQRRAAALARALAAEGHEVVFLSGGFPVAGLDLGGARLEQLAPVRATDKFFKVLVDDRDAPIDEAFKDRRREAVLALFADFRPDILLTEMFPFGRRQMRFELRPLIEAAQAARPAPLIASSVRDILVQSPKPERIAEMLAWVHEAYDLVLVHGDPALVPFERTFPLAREIADKIAYTGYVVERRAEAPGADAPSGEVLVSTGGGAVSEPLLEAALAARPISRARDLPWRVLIGDNLPEAVFRKFADQAGEGLAVERSRPDFSRLLFTARLSISQAGYNTLMEILEARCPAVAVPYAGGLETEQSLRARLLAERDLIEVVEEDALTPEALAAAIDRRLDRRPPAAAIQSDGAAETARLLAEALAVKRGS